MNLYGFVENTPINQPDQLGRCPVCEDCETKSTACLNSAQDVYDSKESAAQNAYDRVESESEDWYEGVSNAVDGLYGRGSTLAAAAKAAYWAQKNAIQSGGYVGQQAALCLARNGLNVAKSSCDFDFYNCSTRRARSILSGECKRNS